MIIRQCDDGVKEGYFSRFFPLSVREGSERATRDHPGIASLGDKLVVVGGAAGPRERLKIVESYDVEMCEWSRLPDLKVAREGPGLVEVSGVGMYAIGGKSSDGTTEVFDGKEWTLVEGLQLKYRDDEYTCCVLQRVV